MAYFTNLDITPKKPLRRAYARDPAMVDRWLNEDYPLLKRQAKKLGRRIFFLEEAGFQSDRPLGRTYGLKGQTPVLPTSGRRQSLNMISAVTARGEFWAATDTGKLKAEALVVFLKNFMQGRKGRVYLVVDGHPAHQANLVTDYVASLGGRLELHPLPPYAPDLNPDEFVWSHMKTNRVSKSPRKKSESLKDRIEEHRLKLQSNPALVRSFFQARSVVYASDW